MENQPILLGNQDGGTATGTAPAFYVLVKQPPTNEKADQGNLVSNQDSCGIASNAGVPVKSKVKTCLPADCTSGGITVTLDNNIMWNEFYHRNTEMIVTKQGRRMFPYCRYWITGLESNLKYILVMDISPVDNYRYKWNGHSWEPSGKAEPHVLGRVFIHPESPSTGHYWMHQPVSFYKLKLTNNTLDQEGHIILHSMHRYLPRLHLVPADKATDVIQLNGPDVHTFTFSQTEFFAVTAYQNIQITQLKIDFNPFAKGFVKDGLKSSAQYKAKKNGRSEHEGFPNDDRCTYSPEADVLDLEQRGLNGSYNNQRMCNTDLEREPFNSNINEHDEPELKQETTEFPIAYPCESGSHVKSLLISNGDINVSIKEELVDDYDYVPNINMERIQLKQGHIIKETEDFSCSDDDPILEKQLKKHSKMERKEVEIKSHKRSHNSPLGVAKTKMLKLSNGTMSTASTGPCEVTKSMVKVSALQAILSSCRTDKSFLRHSENSFVETKIKTLFSGNNEEQQCRLVKDVPRGNIQIRNGHSMKQKPSNFRCVSSAVAKFITGGKRPNTAKKPVLSADVDSNPSVVLSGSCKRGRRWKLKFSEVKEPLKAIMKNHCAPLRPYSDHPEFMLDLENVDGFLFVSFESKEGLNNHIVDKSGRTEEPQNEQAALQITYDSGGQKRLSLLETKLLEDLKSFRHKQVIHPGLQKVGLKLGSVDPTVSIDLKYLGIQLPLSSSKDRVFGNNQGTRPSSLDTGLSFISRSGKTDDFRKIKGWQEKFQNASSLEGSILESSLKNRSAFCSDKLDEYLENEGKLMKTSMGFSAGFSSCPVVDQFPSESDKYEQAQDSILKKKCTPLASYSFQPLSLPFRKSRRNINSKQASSRGSIRSNNSAVPSPVLSKEQQHFQVLEDKFTNSQPKSKTGNTVNVLVMPNLDENVQRKQRTVCQSTQNSRICHTHTKMMELEGCSLQVGKPRTYVTEERADLSLMTLFNSPALLNNRHVCEGFRRQTAWCGSDSCQPGCIYASSPLEKSQPTLRSETECTFDCQKRNLALMKGISIQKKPLHEIITCCNGQEEEWKLEQMNKWETNDDFYKAELKSSINFPMWVKEEETDTKPIYIPTPSATKSTKRVMRPCSEVILPFNKLNPTYDVVKVEQGETPNSKSMGPTLCHSSSNCVLPAPELSSQTVQSKPSPAISVTQATSSLPPKPNLVIEADSLSPQLPPAGMKSVAPVAGSDPKTAFDFCQHPGNAASLVQLQSSSFALLQFPGQKTVPSSIIQHPASPMREKMTAEVEVGAVHLEERKSHIHGTETTELEVTMSYSKPEELLVTQPQFHVEGIMYERNGITSGIAGKNAEMVEQLSSAVPVFQLETVLADHSYFLKETAKMEQHVKLSEDTSNDISHLQLELRNNKPKGVAPAVARCRSKHTEEERCRRKEIKGLFEKLQVTLQLQSLPRVANRILLENAFEEIQGLMNQADKLMDQKKLLMCKQDILIRKASALSGKTQEVVLKKLRYISAKENAAEARKQKQKKQPMNAAGTAETAGLYVQDCPCSETKEVILSKRQEEPTVLSMTGSHATENEDSFLMPRIVNVMSLANEENRDLNMDKNRNPYISLITDSLASKPSFPVMSREINVQYVEQASSPYGNERDATGTSKYFTGGKEISFSQMVEVSSLKRSSESFATKLCIEESAPRQAKEKQIDRGRGRQWTKYPSFQALQVKEPKTLGIEMELQKVVSSVQEATPDASDLVDIKENDETDEILTSLLNEIAFLNQQLDDDASGVSELPNSLSCCFSPGDMESHKESAAADGSAFQFGPLGGNFKNLCLVQESSGCITPLLLHLEDDSIADRDRTLGRPPSKPGVLKRMLGSEVKDPNLDCSTVNIDGSVKHVAPLSKTTLVSPPILKMKTNLEPGKVDTIWKPMPKLAPFGLKPANFPGGQITKVMSLLAKVSSVGLKATQSVTSQEQE
uniref:MAX gene-associated protein-like n=1 Tax=Euleptes europaea TaxID=460621 RepID=UPI00253F966A|nr:MAX gene-associated protein-like [Euleptes europaea]